LFICLFVCLFVCFVSLFFFFFLTHFPFFVFLCLCPPSFFRVVFRSQDPSPEDLIQGGLGNCYFISALACVAQRPVTLEHLFVGPEMNELRKTGVSEHGVYQVRCCCCCYCLLLDF
jgi:hypothetical protein